MQIGHKPQLRNTIFSGRWRQLATAVLKYALIRFSSSDMEASAAAYLSSTSIAIAVTVVWRSGWVTKAFFLKFYDFCFLGKIRILNSNIFENIIFRRRRSEGSEGAAEAGGGTSGPKVQKRSSSAHRHIWLK